MRSPGPNEQSKSGSALHPPTRGLGLGRRCRKALIAYAQTGLVGRLHPDTTPGANLDNAHRHARSRQEAGAARHQGTTDPETEPFSALRMGMRKRLPRRSARRSTKWRAGTEPHSLTPAEPPPKLVGVQAVSVARVPVQIGDRRQLRRRPRVGLERQQDGFRHGMLPGDQSTSPSQGSPHTIKPLDDASPPVTAALTVFLKGRGGGVTHSSRP